MGEGTRPATMVERAIGQGRGGKLSPETVLWVIAASDVILLNEAEPSAADFPDVPLVLARDDGRFLPIFTHQDQFGTLSGGRFPVLELLRSVPEDVGLVVNPGNQLGMELPADGLRAFLSRLLAPLTP